MFSLLVLKTASEDARVDNKCNGDSTFGDSLSRKFVCIWPLLGRVVNVTKTNVMGLTLCEVDVCGAGETFFFFFFFPYVPFETNGNILFIYLFKKKKIIIIC